MSYWAGQDVAVKLSASGQNCLKEVFDTVFVQVFVQWADEHGLWIVRDKQETGEITVMLIKWDHIDTAQLDVVNGPQEVPRNMGFQR